MGRKEKFVYNIHTLTYEKVVVPLKTRIWKAFGFFSVVLITSLAMLAVFYTIFPSPREGDLMREISQMESKYKQNLLLIEEAKRIVFYRYILKR